MLASSALLFGAGAALWGAHARVASRPERPAAVEPALAAPPPTANGASKQTESIVAAYVDVRSAKPVVPRRRTELLPARLAARSDATRASVESQREASDTGQALAAEMSLLSAAEEALARGDLGKARSALSEHQRRFAQPKLREERDGLGVLARCKEQPESAHKQALAFVHKSPSSMLTARIKEACGLNDDG
jgi:hypothetical protein